MKQFLTIILIFSYSFVLSQETMLPSPDDFEGDVNVSASDETGTWENNGTEMDPTFYNGIRYQPMMLKTPLLQYLKIQLIHLIKF